MGTMTTLYPPLRIFCGYAHEDEILFSAIEAGTCRSHPPRSRKHLALW